MLQKFEFYYNKLWSILFAFLLRRSGAKLGIRTIIWPRAYIYHPEKLVIGDNFYANNNLWMNAMGGIVIGDDVLIGPNVVIHSANHAFNKKNIPIRLQGHEKHKVSIGSNVWISASVIILPGVEICDNVVIGAGAVVSKSIRESGIYAGVPASFIRGLNNDDL